MYKVSKKKGKAKSRMCNLAHLETKFWVEKILCHPELEDKCPWEKFGPSAWHDILLEHPEFIRHAPKKIKLSFMSAGQWLEVLARHPELDAYVPAAKSLFNKDSEIIGNLWGRLLARHPQFAKYEPWKHLRSDDWKRVLSQQPQFIDNYERDRAQKNAWLFTLTPNDQADVIACQPSLFGHFNADDFQGSAWATILCNQPQFRERCNLHRVGPYWLGQILACHPEWLDYCGIYSMTPENILRIAVFFPDVLNHYDLDKFREIGNKDTPWIEKYPCLVPYSRLNFSYTYWNALLSRLSSWLKTGKREHVDALAKDAVKSSQKKVPLTVRTKTGLKRPLPDKPKEKNLRNSLDSIMDYRYWVGLDEPMELMETIPPHIRSILKDRDLTYEQLMIKMSMMSEEDCGMVFLGLVIDDPNGFLDRMVADDIQLLVQQVPVKVLLPLTIMYASSNAFSRVLTAISNKHGDAIANFRDKAGNNVWHYYFFRNPLRRFSRKTLHGMSEDDNYKCLREYGCSFDEPNEMGFSYNQLVEAMKKYLSVGDN